MTGRENVTVTVTVDPDLLVEIDGRAKALDLNRSQYFRRLARKDLGKPTNGGTPEPGQPEREQQAKAA